jgi:hypothetical protein
MKNILSSFFVVLLLHSLSCSAQKSDSQESILDQMTGNWILKGTIAGKETIHDITVNWVLDHQYIQITEVSQEKDATGKPEYDAIVFISQEKEKNELTCLWLDNTGNGGLSVQALGHAKQNGNKIEFLFKISDTSIFHTVFLYDQASDSWQWLMDDEENGKFQPFARVNLTRK